jgi:hypothetical protein
MFQDGGEGPSLAEGHEEGVAHTIPSGQMGALCSFEVYWLLTEESDHQLRPYSANMEGSPTPSDTLPLDDEENHSEQAQPTAIGCSPQNVSPVSCPGYSQ